MTRMLGLKFMTSEWCFCHSVRETVIEVEYPLVDAQLKELDGELEKAINQLNWTSEGETIIVACVPN